MQTFETWKKGALMTVVLGMGCGFSFLLCYGLASFVGYIVGDIFGYDIERSIMPMTFVFAFIYIPIVVALVTETASKDWGA